MDEPIKIERNALDVLEAIVSLSCLVGVTAYLILAWSTIPARIPAHYDAAGEVNRWGSKSELIMLPIISWLIYGMITLIERFPQAWNTGCGLPPAEEPDRVRQDDHAEHLFVPDGALLAGAEPADVVPAGVSRAALRHDCVFYRETDAHPERISAGMMEQE